MRSLVGLAGPSWPASGADARGIYSKHSGSGVIRRSPSEMITLRSRLRLVEQLCAELPKRQQSGISSIYLSAQQVVSKAAMVPIATACAR